MCVCDCVCVQEGPADQPERGRAALQARESAGCRAPPRRVRAQADCAQGRERQTRARPGGELSSLLSPFPIISFLFAFNSHQLIILQVLLHSCGFTFLGLVRYTVLSERCSKWPARWELRFRWATPVCGAFPRRRLLPLRPPRLRNKDNNNNKSPRKRCAAAPTTTRTRRWADWRPSPARTLRARGRLLQRPNAHLKLAWRALVRSLERADRRKQLQKPKNNILV